MTESEKFIADLGDGLILRRAKPADAERLAAFNSAIHAEGLDVATDPTVATWTRDLLTRPHPTFRPELFALVEDRQRQRIISSLNLIPQTWTYEGIPFGVGRVELVGTDSDYRRRGLVRRQMEVVHRWSAAMGHLVQGITGIPWYYRQFGYEMTIALEPSVQLPVDRLPQLAAGEDEPYRVRPATPADLDAIAALDRRGRQRWLVSCERDAALWRYELDGRSAGNAEAVSLAVAETAPAPAPVIGYLVYRQQLWGSRPALVAAEVAPDISWLAVAPSLVRYLSATGGALAASADPATTLAGIILLLGPEHPLRQVLADRLAFARPAYAWYIRVANLPVFVRRIAPVLERRLVTSAAANYTGELALGFYRDGLRLRFEAGKLLRVDPWPNPDRRAAGANFPPLTFLHLLFGHRSLAELEHAFPDCGVRQPVARVLLNALFPSRPSGIWPVA